MKKICLIACSLLISLTLNVRGAFPQAGNIVLTPDTLGCDCGFTNVQGWMQVIVVHVDTPGATGCRFSIQTSGAPVTWVGEYCLFQKTGDVTTGVEVDYGGCLAEPILVMAVTYVGVSDPCDIIQVAPHPAATPPGVYITDCVEPDPNQFALPDHYYTFINSDGSCDCPLPIFPLPDRCKVPVEKTTWGKVKHIYQ